MLSTFNCGVGFCIIVSKKNLPKIKKLFPKILDHMKLDTYLKSNQRVHLLESLRW